MRGRHLALALLVPFSWSWSFVAGKYVMTVTPDGPATVTFIRFAFALVVLLPLLLRMPRLQRLSGREWLHLGGLALCCVGLYHYLFFAGLTYAPAGMSSIVLAVLPILINIGAGLFLKESVNGRTYLGAVLAFGGITLIALEKGHWTLQGWGRGETLTLCAALTWLVYTLSGRSLFRRHHTVVLSIYMFVLGTTALLPVVACERVWPRLGEVSGWWWLSVAYMGLAATAFGYVAFNASVKHLGAGRTAVFLLIVPPITNLWDLLIFHTPLTAVKCACIGLVVFGVWLALSGGRGK